MFIVIVVYVRSINTLGTYNMMVSVFLFNVNNSIYICILLFEKVLLYLVTKATVLFFFFVNLLGGHH